MFSIFKKYKDRDPSKESLAMRQLDNSGRIASEMERETQENAQRIQNENNND